MGRDRSHLSERGVLGFLYAEWGKWGLFIGIGEGSWFWPHFQSKLIWKLGAIFGPFFWEGNSVWFGPEISHQLLILNPTPNPCDGLHPGTLCARKRPKIPKQNPGIGKESTEIEHDVSECLKNFCPKCIFEKSQNILHISGCRVSFATNFYRTPKYLVQPRKKCSCNVVTGVPASKAWVIQGSIQAWKNAYPPSESTKTTFIFFSTHFLANTKKNTKKFWWTHVNTKLPSSAHDTHKKFLVNTPTKCLIPRVPRTGLCFCYSLPLHEGKIGVSMCFRLILFQKQTQRIPKNEDIGRRNFPAALCWSRKKITWKKFHY